MKLKIEHDNGTTTFPLNEINETEITKEQLRKEYWPFLEPQPLLSKLLIQGTKTYNGGKKCVA